MKVSLNEKGLEVSNMGDLSNSELFDLSLARTIADIDMLEGCVSTEWQNHRLPLLTSAQTVLLSKIKADIETLYKLRGGE